MKRKLGVAVALIAAGCAATYSPPASRQAEFERTVAGSGEKLFDAAKLALTLGGYQIVSSDRRLGLISTGRRQIDLTDVETDCGTTLGLPYILDKRTITYVALGVVTAENKLSIKANIEGEYLRSNDVQSIALTCVSSGKIEEALFRKISGRLD